MSEDKLNDMLDEILLEDDQKIAKNPEGVENDQTIQNEQKICECTSRSEGGSRRFCLLVMEAMRSLRREDDEVLPTCRIEEIVDHIGRVYRSDGDLYAQARTALKQVCSQGFVIEMLEDEYYFVGPVATSMNRITCSNDRKDCLPSSRDRDNTLKRKRKRFCKDFETKEKDLGSCDCEDLSGKSYEVKASRRNENRKEQKAKSLSNGTTDSSTSISVSSESTNDCSCKRDSRQGNRNLSSSKRQESLRNRGENTTKSNSRNKDTSRNHRTNEEVEQEVRSKRAIVKRKENEEKIHDEDSEGTLTESLNEVYRDLTTGKPKTSKTRDKELKRWIKKCRKDCERKGGL